MTHVENHNDCYSFKEADNELLETINIGAYVKIRNSKERFWVKVTAVNGPSITGRVKNDLIEAGLKYNDIVHFKNKHVLVISCYNW